MARPIDSTTCTSYNELRTKIAKHIQDGHAPPSAIFPDKIESRGLFALDVDDVIWQDVGLNDDGSEEPPRLCDVNVRNGILASYVYDMNAMPCKNKNGK